VDLTLTVRPGMRGVDIESRHTLADDGFNTRTLHLYSHCGTHMDAPLHFSAGEGTIDRIPLADCLGPAWVADLPGIQAGALITVGDLGEIADRVHPGDGLLLRTGWSRHVDNARYYRDHFPRVSRALAEWCVAAGVRVLGVEAPSVANVNDIEELTAVHTILLGGGVIVVEGLTNLEALREERVFFCAVPLKIEGGDGSPCRAFALEGGALGEQG